jgi:Glycosyl hydrolase family 47
MAESFTVDVCEKEPCHWAPPSTGLHPDTVSTDTDDDQGLETQTHTRVKRQSESDDLTAQDQFRQGPPRPEAPHNDQGEVIESTQHDTGNVDPNVEQIAIDRQQATQFVQAVDKPASFHYGMDTRYILRPEAIESVFYMWRITGDPIWQEKGWQMWEAIERVSWTELAYSAIQNVNIPDSPKADSMERYPR